MYIMFDMKRDESREALTLQNSDALMIRVLKVVFAVLLLWMIWVVVETSLRSSLIEEWDTLAAIPWMTATLKDFYTNVFVIFLWVCWKEPGVFRKLLWLILLVGLGSIATTFYVLLQLFRLRPGEGIRELIVRRNGA